MPKDLGKGADDKLPRLKPLTDEEQAAIDKQQRQMATVANLGTSGSQLTLNRDRAYVAQHEGIPVKDLTSLQVERLGRAYAGVGRYQDAYKLTKDPAYRAIQRAIDTPKACKCADTVDVQIVEGQPVETTHSRMFVRRRIFVGEWKDLLMCNICGSLAVR